VDAKQVFQSGFNAEFWQGGGIDNEHLTDKMLCSVNRIRASVRACTLMVSHVGTSDLGFRARSLNDHPVSLSECTFTFTLKVSHAPISARALVLNVPPVRLTFGAVYGGSERLKEAGPYLFHPFPAQCKPYSP
jgi:hypothetical protein